MLPPPASAMFYIRTASIDQRSVALIQQEIDCRALITRHGYLCTGGRSDLGASGARQSLPPGLTDLVRLAREQAFQVLVVTSLDRLARSTAAVSDIFDALEDSGVVIITVQHGIVHGVRHRTRDAGVRDQD